MNILYWNQELPLKPYNTISITLNFEEDRDPLAGVWRSHNSIYYASAWIMTEDLPEIVIRVLYSRGWVKEFSKEGPPDYLIKQYNMQTRIEDVVNEVHTTVLEFYKDIIILTDK